MKPFSVYLIEAGFPAEPPVFLPGSPCCSFPFWGHYSFLDFAVANLSGWADGCVQVVADGRFRGVADAFGAQPIARAWPIHLVEDGLAGLLPLLQADEAERIFVFPLSQVFLAEPGSLAGRLARPAAEITRLSVDHTAMDLYIVRRRTLIKQLKEHLAGHPGGLQLAEWSGGLLAGAFELIDDVPGQALFQNNLMHLYHNNLWLAAQLGSRELGDRVAHLNHGRLPGGEIRIEKGGTVKSSFLAAGTVVEGYVEASVLFPGVIVRRGAVVSQSIVMSNNCVGAKAQVFRSLILPQPADSGAANIGEESFIGQRQSGTANSQYPTQLRDGITVLGASPQVPRGFSIGPGCLVGATVSAQQLRAAKEMRKGSTIVCSTGP